MLQCGACFSPQVTASMSPQCGKPIMHSVHVQLLCVYLSTCCQEPTWDTNVTRSRFAWFKHSHMLGGKGRKFALSGDSGSPVCLCETHTHTVHTKACEKTMTLGLNQQTGTGTGCCTASVCMKVYLARRLRV